jgi:hypothetical protein
VVHAAHAPKTPPVLSRAAALVGIMPPQFWELSIARAISGRDASLTRCEHFNTTVSELSRPVGIQQFVACAEWSGIWGRRTQQETT